MSVSIQPIKNASYHIKGDVELQNEDGTLKEIVKKDIFLCRCGCSKNKPFCDGSHKSVQFDSSK